LVPSWRLRLLQISTTFATPPANYIARYRATGGSIREFLSAAQAETTLDLTPLNEDWIFSTDWIQRVSTMATVEALFAHYRSHAD
jgi:hypothetical protein